MSNMVPYTTNFTNRFRTTAGIAVIATLVVIGIGTPLNAVIGLITADRIWLAALLPTATPMGLYALLAWLYENRLWRMPVVGAGIPYVGGFWRGEVTFLDMGGGFDCEVNIRQTWTKISINFHGLENGVRQTHSSVIMAALNLMENTGGLRYEYIVEAEPGVTNQLLAIGTAHLLVDDGDPNHMFGDYHNQPQPVDGKFFHHHGRYEIWRQPA